MTAPDISAAQQLLTRAGASIDRLLSGSDADRLAAMIDVDADAVERRYEDGVVALQDARYGEAADAFAEAAVARPDIARYHFALGLCFQQLDHVNEALEQFATALALDATDAAAAFRLGECFMAGNRFDDAREALRMSVQLCALPENDPCIRPLAEALLDRLAAEGA